MHSSLVKGQTIHIIGIGGYGMSAIARILLERGFRVSGSDQQANALSVALEEAGATVMIGHRAENIQSPDYVFASSAIPDHNIEIQAAQDRHIPVFRRREAIGLLTEGYRTIAVAGTHGKTTTTALITHILLEAGFAPTYIIGGVLRNTGQNAALGTGDIFVIEADEYQEMFLGLSPSYGVVTNVEYDHPDIFPDFAAVEDVFRRFVTRLGEKGILVGCLDNISSALLVQERQTQNLPLISYGVQNTKGTWTARQIFSNLQHGTDFVVEHKGTRVSRARLSLAGKHNVQNALAAIAIAHHLEIPMPTIMRALESFAGTGRRSEVMGAVDSVMVVNDYAHHPTAIQVTLEAWAIHPHTRRLWAIWQPHTYTRMRTLQDDFAAAFEEADYVLVTDVYSVREQVDEGLDAPQMAALIRQNSQTNARYSGSLEKTARLLMEEVESGDCIVILSAGDAPEIGTKLLQYLAARGGPTDA